MKLLAGVGGGVAVLLLSGCDKAHGFLAAAGPVAEAQRAHFLSVVGWMMVVILPLFVGLPIALWRYRLKRPRGRYAPDWQFNRTIEILIWGVPVVVVLVLALHLWRWTHLLDPYKPLPSKAEPLQVQVLTLDWKFLFIYPGAGVASVNELVIPAGRPVHFSLSSGTVMQSFIIPRLGGQVYAMAGMVTQLNLLADAPGTFRGENAQYNGKHFAEQKFPVRVVPPDAFGDWLQKVRNTGKKLDAARYAILAKPGVAKKPAYFGTVSDGLFDHVVAGFNVGSAPDSAQAHEKRGGT